MENSLRVVVAVVNWIPGIEDGALLELLRFTSYYNLFLPFPGFPNTTQTLYLWQQKLPLTFSKHLYHRSFHSQEEKKKPTFQILFPLDRLQRPRHSSLVIFLFLRNIILNYFWIMWEETVYIFYFKSNLRWSSLAQRQFKNSWSLRVETPPCLVYIE